MSTDWMFQSPDPIFLPPQQFDPAIYAFVRQPTPPPSPPPVLDAYFPDWAPQLPARPNLDRQLLPAIAAGSCFWFIGPPTPASGMTMRNTIERAVVVGPGYTLVD